MRVPSPARRRAASRAWSRSCQTLLDHTFRELRTLSREAGGARGRGRVRGREVRRGGGRCRRPPTPRSAARPAGPVRRRPPGPGAVRPGRGGTPVRRAGRTPPDHTRRRRTAACGRGDLHRLRQDRPGPGGADVVQGEADVEVHLLEDRRQIGGLALIGPAVQEQHRNRALDEVQPVRQVGRVHAVQSDVVVAEPGVELEGVPDRPPSTGGGGPEPGRSGGRRSPATARPPR